MTVYRFEHNVCSVYIHIYNYMCIIYIYIHIHIHVCVARKRGFVAPPPSVGNLCRGPYVTNPCRDLHI